VGGILMVLGAGVILFPKASGWHIGDVIIAIATAVPPIGNMYAQLARRSVSAEWIMFCRSIIGGIFLLIFATIVEPVPAVSEVSHSIPFLLLNGCLLLGLSKILWIDGINLIPITKATSFVGLTPLFTLILAALVLGEPVQLYHILSLLPIMAGMFLLTRKQDIEPGMP
jgi:drug/metabolite transporter (DMT)-like permease